MTIVDGQGREHVIARRDGTTAVVEVPREVMDYLLAVAGEIDALRREVSDLRRMVVDHETEDAT